MTEASSDVQTAASDRARLALADLERLDITAFSRLSLSLRDAERRSPMREEAVRAAERGGLGALLDESRRRAREHVTGAFDRAPFQGIGIDVAEVRSRASVDDRVAAMLAAEDAVIAAVADPYLSDEVRDALTIPFERLHPSDERGVSIPAAGQPPRTAISARTAMLAFGALVVVSLVLAVLGYGIGLAGLGAAVAVVLVALVMRGRP